MIVTRSQIHHAVDALSPAELDRLSLAIQALQHNDRFALVHLLAPDDSPTPDEIASLAKPDDGERLTFDQIRKELSQD